MLTLANEVSPTEPASGILVIVDSDVDIDQAGSDMTDAVNEPMSTPDLQESPDGDSSDAVSSESGPQFIGLLSDIDSFSNSCAQRIILFYYSDILGNRPA